MRGDIPLSTVSSSIVSDGGPELFYFRYGKSGGIPIILLHGLSQQADFWNPTIHELALIDNDELDVIVVDQRGHGLSQGFTEHHDLSIKALAKDVEALLNHLSIKRVFVVGHSMGAMVATQFAANFPDRVSGILLIDGGIRTPRDGLHSGMSTREEILSDLAPPPGPFSESDLIDYYGRLDPENVDSVMAAIRRTYRSVGFDQYTSTLGLSRHMKLLNEILDGPSFEILQHLQVPVWALICHGQTEQTVQMLQNWSFLANYQHMHLQHWYGYQHDLPLQRPAMIASLISSVSKGSL